MPSPGKKKPISPDKQAKKAKPKPPSDEQCDVAESEAFHRGHNDKSAYTSKAPPPPGQESVYAQNMDTAMIGPSDFQHIFNYEKDASTVAVEKSEPPAMKINSQTPTQMIAPSDFEHIYRDAEAIAEADRQAVPTTTAAAAKQPRTSPSKFGKPFRDASLNKMFQRARPKWANEDSPKAGEPGGSQPARELDVLPNEIVEVVKRFVEKQKKTYTINKK